MRQRDFISDKKWKKLQERNFIPDYQEDMPCVVEIIGDIRSNNFYDESIDFSLMEIGDKGIKALSSALSQNPCVKYLNLMANRIGDDGASDLAEMLKGDKAIYYLDLSCNFIGDRGLLDIITVLECNTHITHCDVSGNPNIQNKDNIRQLDRLLHFNQQLLEGHILQKDENSITSKMSFNSSYHEVMVMRKYHERSEGNKSSICLIS